MSQKKSSLEVMFSEPDSGEINFSGFEKSFPKNVPFDVDEFKIPLRYSNSKNQDFSGFDQMFPELPSSAIEDLFNDSNSTDSCFLGFQPSIKEPHSLSVDVLFNEPDLGEVNFSGFVHSTSAQKKGPPKKAATNLNYVHQDSRSITNVNNWVSKDCSVLVHRLSKEPDTDQNKRKSNFKERKNSGNKYTTDHRNSYNDSDKNHLERISNGDSIINNDVRVRNTHSNYIDFNNFWDHQKPFRTKESFANSFRKSTIESSNEKSNGHQLRSFDCKTLILVNILEDLNSVFKICSTFGQYGELCTVKLLSKKDKHLYNLDTTVDCACVKFESNEGALTAFTQFIHKETSLYLVKLKSKRTPD